MNRFRIFAFGLALLLFSSLAPAQSSYLTALGRYVDGEVVSFNQTAEDGDIALFVRYVGTTVGTNTVAVAAGGDIAFVEDSSADTTIGTCGATPGTLDVSNTACDTLGEVVDLINSSANWVAVIHAGLRTDTSTDYLATLSATDAGLVEGVSLYWDSDVANIVTHVVSDVSSLEDYVGNDRTGDLLSNPWRGTRANLVELLYTINFGTAGSLTIYSVDVDNRAGSETVTTIFGAQAATDNSETLFDRKPFGVFGRKDEKLIVRFSDTGTVAGVTTVSGYGTEFDAR